MYEQLKDFKEDWNELSGNHQEFAKCGIDPHYFITKYVRTFDENDGESKLYPDFDYLREKVIPEILKEGNAYWPKSQRMLITISFCAVDLWLWLFREGENIYWTSKNERAVDNGGENANWNSVSGKIRFMYDRLPGWLKEMALGKALHSKFMWKKGSMKNPKNDNLITFEAPISAAGVGQGFTRARIDEAANVVYMETIHVNLTMSCRNNRHYISYPLGRTNFFAKLHFTPKHFDFRMVEVHWRENPTYDEEWYEQQMKRLTPFYIAQRLDISFEESAEGKVWEKFNYSVNVGEFEFVEGVPVYLFWDYGFKDYTSVGFACRMDQTRLRIFDWYQANFKGYRDIAKSVREILNKYGFEFRASGKDSEGFDKYELKAGHIQMYGDPSAKARRETGPTLQDQYEEQGLPVETCDSHNSIVVLDKIDDAFKKENIEIDERAEAIIESARYWEWPKDRQGNPKPGVTQPAHDQFSHAGKALEYGFFMTMMESESSEAIKDYSRQSAMVKEDAKPILDYSEL